ncbi:MAG: NTP transferase domain-containing protein [Planctomycetes bacterium]|nr:NTP transferase domain-containing protein [Planctomycetota bacterium]
MSQSRAGLRTVAIVPAAGLGERMGQDKALLDLGGKSAIARIVATCCAAGIGKVLIVRRNDAAPLPELSGDGVEVTLVKASGKGEMADSLRMAFLELPRDAEAVMVFPVDHALVEADTLLALRATLLRDDCDIALPLYRQQPGHPVAMTRAVFAEIDRGGVTMRDVVRRDAERVRAVTTSNPWVRCDLDRPEDLRSARAALTGQPWSTVAQMFRHRSHRSYRPDPIPDPQIERLVDAARHASTSSFIQAYAVVAVRDAELKNDCARLCGGQRHIVEAPVFLAICADLSKLAEACTQHGTELQSQSFELFLQATVDAALLGQNLALAAEAEGFGVCMIGAARNHPLELAQKLGLPAHCYVVFGMTVGVPADDPVPRGRMPLSGVLHWNRYDASDVADVLRKADDGMRAWARRTNAEQGGYNGRPVGEDKGWAERMAKAWGEGSSYAAAREVLIDELRQLGFGIE